MVSKKGRRACLNGNSNRRFLFPHKKDVGRVVDCALSHCQGLPLRRSPGVKCFMRFLIIVEKNEKQNFPPAVTMQSIVTSIRESFRLGNLQNELPILKTAPNFAIAGK